jgi:hypothetical protein
MLISNAFPSQYLKASDLQGRTASLTIDRCEMADLDGEHKPCLYFVGKDKGMILNRTNGATIVESYGDETNDWQGKPLEVFTARVSFQGRMVDGLRVRIPAPAGQAPDGDTPW